MELKMDIYSPGLTLLGTLEIQNSVIWERKAFGAGSFSVNSLITDESRELLKADNIIWISDDDAGVIEYIHEESGDSGPYINVKGRDLTGILAWRILWGRYDLDGAVVDIMRQLVDDCCIHPTRGDVEARVIPGLVLSGDSGGGPSIRAQKTGGELLEALSELGETYQVPFGVRFNPAVPQMEFWARPGVNRTVNQTDVDPVFYSTELDDVLSSEYAYDSGNYKNVTLVAGEGEGADRVMITVENEIEEPVEPTPPGPPTPPEPPAPVTYTISLTVDPEGGGVASGGGTVESGASVTVTAAASSGYVFSGWMEAGEIVSTDSSYTFTASGNRALTAVFAVAIVEREIIVTVTGSSLSSLLSAGTLTVAGVTITGNTTVTTTASTAEVEFTLTCGISQARSVAVNGVDLGHVKAAGDTVSTTLSVQDGMTIAVAFTSYYEQYTITVSADPSNGGTVSGGGSYQEGNSVTLTQTTADGYRFSGWYSGDTLLSTNSTYTFNPTSSATITAKYVVIPVYTVTASIDPAGSGTVTGAGTYQEGASVTVTATPGEGYNFSGWQEGGQTVSESASYTFTISGNRNLTAAFAVKAASRLPAGYTEVEYIQSATPAYINTGVKPTSNLKFLLDIEPLQDDGTALKYIAYSNYTNTSTKIRYTLELNWRNEGVRLATGQFSTTANTPYIVLDSNISHRRMSITVDYPNRKAFVSGETEKTISSVSVTTSMSTINLLRGSSDTYALLAKIYSCQIYSGDTQTRDFVPCINPTGKVGLYDLVNNTFYGNAGTGSFTAGPAV